MVQRQAGDVKTLGLALQPDVARHNVEVLCQRDAMAVRHHKDLVLAVRVEGRPLDRRRVVVRRAPVIRDCASIMAHYQHAALVCARQAHDEQAKRLLRARHIEVRLEKA